MELLVCAAGAAGGPLR